MTAFLDALRSGRVLLMDGAMGTELQRAGLKPGECGELWNLTDPERVQVIHQRYADAGATVFLTNTFQAIKVPDRLPEVLHSGVVLLHNIRPVPQFVLADVGAIDLPAPERRLENIRECRQLITSIKDVDGVLAETWTDLTTLITLLKANVEYSHPHQWPFLVSATYMKDARGRIMTFRGKTPEQWARKAGKCFGVIALGVNCGRDIGMDETIEIIRRYRSVTDLPLFARPNAGTPTRVGGEWVYPQSPEEMAARLPELLEAGVCMVGGCCGTTPAHIAAFRKVIDAWNARHA
jgi:5-methyltetrahydrofolate--homocysteine methyltransferase